MSAQELQIAFVGPCACITMTMHVTMCILTLCVPLCVRVRRWVCACIQHLPAANEWRPTSPAGLAVLCDGAGAGCFLMVITHFVPGWIILHWHCLGPGGEPHKVDPASQRATKNQMQQQHPTPGLHSSTHTRVCRHTHARTHKNAYLHRIGHTATGALISYSQFHQGGPGSLKWAACAEARTQSPSLAHTHQARIRKKNEQQYIRMHFQLLCWKG